VGQGVEVVIAGSFLVAVVRHRIFTTNGCKEIFTQPKIISLRSLTKEREALA
jgi:hypothetical protein